MSTRSTEIKYVRMKNPKPGILTRSPRHLPTREFSFHVGKAPANGKEGLPFPAHLHPNLEQDSSEVRTTPKFLSTLYYSKYVL